MAGTTSLEVALLDVNVLVAMCDDSHVHHMIAHDWFASHQPGAWATCPLTENGFVRTVSRSFPENDVRRVENSLHMLRRFRNSSGHRFWPDDVSVADALESDRVRRLGRQQLTDVYLLALAVKHNGTLVTFDRGITLDAVRNAGPEHLALLAPGEESRRRPTLSLVRR